MKQKLKNEKGITLVALVITIIVLLILAGVTLSMVMGDNGIFGKANQAKEQTQLSNAEEIIKLAVLENKVKSVSGDADALTNEELKTEIGKKLTEQGYTVSGSTVTYYGDKTINIENYLDKEKTTTYTAYNVGDQVTVGGEKFYVIKASSESKEKVTLLAEKNIDTTTMVQSDSANTIAFSSTNYWKNIEGITYPYNLNGVETSVSTDVINIAKAYGTAKGGEGRLMTYEEANELKTTNSTMIYGTNTTAGYLNYWLGSAGSSDFVWGVCGKNSNLDYNHFGFLYGGVYGVRPVIEISKSLI